MRKLVLSLLLFVAVNLIQAQTIQLTNGGSTTTAENATANSANPISAYFEYMHFQVVYTAAEINAAGITGAKSLTGLGWYVSTATSNTIPSYQIRMANTSATNSAVHDATALTLVYSPASFTPVAGSFNMLTLNGSFVWDGTSNILVDVCFGPAVYATPYGDVRTYATTTTNGSRRTRADGTPTCAGTTNSANNFKPQVSLTFATPPSCVSPSGLTNNPVGTTTASHSWSAVSGATGYQWAVTTSATPPASGTATSLTTSSSSGLTAVTQYYLHVRTVCGAAFSVWSTSPFTTSFDCSTATSITGCGISQTATIAAGNGVYDFSGTNPNNSCGYATPGIEKLYKFTPTTTGIYTLNITGVTNTTYIDYLFKDATSADCSPTGWTCIRDRNAISQTTFGPLTAGVTYYILLDPEGTSGAGQTFDLICPAAPPTCLLPADYISPLNTATNVTYQSNVTFTWNNVPGATTYDIYLQTGTSPTIATTLFAANFAAQAGATTSGFWSNAAPATSYIWYVVPKNSGGGLTSCGFSNAFTTAAAPVAPVNDSCGAAITLTVNANQVCTVVTAGTTFGATPSPVTPAPSCSVTGINDDVWYTFVANGTSNIINITGVDPSADIATQVYSGGCNAAVLVGCSSTFPYTVTGLTNGMTYHVRVFTVADLTNNRTNFNICITTPPNPPTNDDCSAAVNLTVATGFCTNPTNGTLQSATATLPALADPICQTNVNGGIDVWYKVTVPTTGKVTVQTNAVNTTTTDLVLVAYSGTCGALTVIDCNDDNNPNSSPSGNHPWLGLTGLTIGSEVYFRVLGYSTATNLGAFSICAFDTSSSVMPIISTGVNCVNGTVNIDSSMKYTRVALRDGTGNIIAEVYPNGNKLGITNYSYFINSGAVRTDVKGVKYLDRNITITPTTQPTSNVDVRLYYKTSELDALQLVDPLVTSSNINVTKTTNTCATSNNPITDGLIYLQTSNSAFALDSIVTVSVPSFSTFFLHGGVIALPVTLSTLRGEVTGTTNTIYWATATESNSSKFVIERSINGSSFTSLGEVATKAINGNSNSTLSYSFVDANPTLGKAYYRIQMVDNSNNAKFSQIVSLRRGAGKLEIVDVRPNPTTGTLSFNVLGASSNIIVAVRDLSGKTLLNKGLVQSSNFSIDMSNLSTGMYILEATDVRSGEKAIFKVIKN